MWVLNLFIASAAWVFDHGSILLVLVLLWLVANLRCGSKIMDGQNAMIKIYERWAKEHRDELDSLHELLKRHMAERERANADYLKLTEELMQARRRNDELWDEIVREAERPIRGGLRG